ERAKHLLGAMEEHDQPQGDPKRERPEVPRLPPKQTPSLHRKHSPGERSRQNTGQKGFGWEGLPGRARSATSDEGWDSEIRNPKPLRRRATRREAIKSPRCLQAKPCRAGLGIVPDVSKRRWLGGEAPEGLCQKAARSFELRACARPSPSVVSKVAHVWENAGH